MITVELVKRAFNDLADIKKYANSETNPFAEENQSVWPGDPSTIKEPDQSHFVRYRLIPPQADDAAEDEGEGEEQEDEYEEKSEYGGNKSRANSIEE